MNFQLDIISLEGTIYSGEAKKIKVPSIEGEMVVLARHMPVVTALTLGEVIVTTPNKNIFLSIGKGILEFSKGRARLLIEDVKNADEISEEKVLEAKRKAEELIVKGVSEEEKIKASYTLRRSLVDLKLLRKKKLI